MLTIDVELVKLKLLMAHHRIESLKLVTNDVKCTHNNGNVGDSNVNHWRIISKAKHIDGSSQDRIIEASHK